MGNSEEQAFGVRSKSCLQSTVPRGKRERPAAGPEHPHEIAFRHHADTQKITSPLEETERVHFAAPRFTGPPPCSHI